MSDTIEVMQSLSFTGTMQALLQAQGGKLEGLVTTSPQSGKGARIVEQVAQRAAQRRNTRNGDTPIGSTAHDSRWLYPIDWEVPADLVDDQDIMKIVTDPSSMYVRNQVNALRRARDQVVLSAMFGSAQTGETGTTTTTFNTSRDVVSIDVGGTSSGLNAAKLRALRERFQLNNVDLEMEPVYMILTPTAEKQLLNDTEAKSFDYTDYGAVKTGKLPGLYGIEFITMNLADSVAYPELGSTFGTSSERYLPAWVGSGIHMGIWEDIKGFVSVRDDKSYATQIYSRCSLGATRTEEGKVIRVSINETV